MKFKNNIELQTSFVKYFWKYINVSYNIERLFEENENVLITLIDDDISYRFIYFRAKDGGKGIRILNDTNEYVAVLWNNNSGIPIGGNANGELELKRCECILSKLKKAINFGLCEMIVEKCNILQPLTDIEQKYFELINEGKETTQIVKILSISKEKAKRIRRSLRSKLPSEVSEKILHPIYS